MGKVFSLIQATILGSVLMALYLFGWIIILPLIVISFLYAVIQDEKARKGK